MLRATPHRLFACRTAILSLVICLPHCGSGSEGDTGTPVLPGPESGTPEGGALADGGSLPDGGSTGKPDGALGEDVTVPDGGKVPDGGTTPPSDGGQGSCSAGARRCSPGNIVEVCNAGGTSWLYSASCAVDCNDGLCTGGCNAGEKRCNGNSLETCDASGKSYSVTKKCDATCSYGACDRVALDVALNTNLDGEVRVTGAVLIHSGATLSSPKGDLTLYADSITVENGASIAVAPTGKTPNGAATNYAYGGGGGSYGTLGQSSRGPAGLQFGSDVDSKVSAGSPGGDATSETGAKGGLGGGVIRLIAKTIRIDGQVTATGASGTGVHYGGGGGSGGGILVAGDDVTITGSLSVAGGAGAGDRPSAGGQGRIKVLSGSKRTVTGSLTGKVTSGMLPPLDLGSSSHPEQTVVYNDGFDNVTLAFSRPFGSAQGYYVLVDRIPINPPTPATGKFLAQDYITIPASSFPAGLNYIHIVPVDATSNVGAVESTYVVNVNGSPPSLSSQSHPNQGAWSDNANPFFAWTFPAGDASTVGAHYVFDNYGLTVPGSGATFLPTTQKQQLMASVAPGVWLMHVVSKDKRGYLTKTAAHYRVNIGTDPGSGGVLGQVIDNASKPLKDVAVSLNRGVYTQLTNTTGNFNFNTVPAGTWEVTATSKNKSVTTQVTVTKGGAATANLTLP